MTELKKEIVMKNLNREQVVRASLILLILLSGVAMIPYIDAAQIPLSWRLYGAVYEPELVVNEPVGAPGSIFTFTGSNYPANSVAAIYLDGEALGTVTTDANGMATFLIHTIGMVEGVYNVTMEVDINATATETFTLVEGAEVIPAPPDSTDPIFYGGHVMFFPLLFK
jgi:hypothetical protein